MAHVLIVDDTRDAARAMAALLKVLGHGTDCVPGGREALDYLHLAMPDLIILDLSMPGMDGREVLRAVRASPRTKALPVVMYSAVSDPDVREELMESGANDYWVKASVNLDKVERRIEQLLSTAKS